MNRPRRVLGVGLALAVLGWGVGTQIETRLRHPRAGAAEHPRGAGPQPAAGRDRRLRRARRQGRGPRPDRSGDAAVDGRLQAPGAARQRIRRRPTRAASTPKSARARRSRTSSSAAAGRCDARDVRATLAELPAYDLRQVAPVDPRTGLPGHTALLSFGIRAQSLEDQQALIDRVRGEIGEPGAPGGPPPGVDVAARRPARDRRRGGDRPLQQPLLADPGRPARASPWSCSSSTARSRARSCRWCRSSWPAAGPPSSSGPAGIPLNPMSAALGALTIAIATEFSVILSARFHEERGGGPRARPRRCGPPTRAPAPPCSPPASPRPPASRS